MDTSERAAISWAAKILQLRQSAERTTTEFYMLPRMGADVQYGVLNRLMSYAVIWQRDSHRNGLVLKSLILISPEVMIMRSLLRASSRSSAILMFHRAVNRGCFINSSIALRCNVCRQHAA